MENFRTEIIVAYIFVVIFPYNPYILVIFSKDNLFKEKIQDWVIHARFCSAQMNKSIETTTKDNDDLHLVDVVVAILSVLWQKRHLPRSPLPIDALHLHSTTCM